MRGVIWAAVRTTAGFAAFLLAAVLLLFVLVLVIPVRYSLLFQKDREAPGKADAQISWLFQAVSLWIRVEEERGRAGLRILGIPVHTFSWKKNHESGTRKQAEAPGEFSCQDAASENSKASAARRKGKERQNAGQGDLSRETSGSTRKHRKKRRRFKGSRVEAFVQSVSRLWALLREKETGKAASKTVKLVFRILCQVFPSEMGGQISFGMENPCNTGYVLAALGMTVPLHRNLVTVTPDFEAEENFLSGEAFLKGRLIVGKVIWIAAKGFFDRDIRMTVMRLQGKAL